jgi:hypothetical protein
VGTDVSGCGVSLKGLAWRGFIWDQESSAGAAFECHVLAGDCPYRLIGIYVGGFELSSLDELKWFTAHDDLAGLEKCVLKFDSRLGRA